MEKQHIILLLVIGTLLLIAAIYVRVRFGEKYELKPLDLALIVLPLIFVAVVTGKMKGFDAFGVKADFSELFADVAKQDIDKQVSGFSSPGVNEVVDMLQIAGKAGVQRIPELIKNKTQGLVFRLGHGGYYGPAIEKYYDALYASSYLQYFIVLDEEEKFFGVINILDLAVTFRTEGQNAFRQFAKWLNQPTKTAQDSIAALPGFIGLKNAAKTQTSKLKVLEKMDQWKLDRLPVVNQENRFVGILDRSKLTASVLLELAQQIE